MTSWRTNASTSRSRGQMWKGEAEVRICDAHDANEAGGEGPPLHQQHPFQPLQQSPIQQPWWEKKTGRSKSEADRYSFRVVHEGWAGHREVTPNTVECHSFPMLCFFLLSLWVHNHCSILSSSQGEQINVTPAAGVLSPSSPRYLTYMSNI